VKAKNRRPVGDQQATPCHPTQEHDITTRAYLWHFLGLFIRRLSELHASTVDTAYS